MMSVADGDLQTQLAIEAREGRQCTSNGLAGVLVSRVGQNSESATHKQ